MLETNLRIVAGGVDLRVPVRYARVETALVTNEVMERACNLLGSRQQLGARPVPGQDNQLVVLSDAPLPAMRIEDEDASIMIQDLGSERCELNFADDIGNVVVPALLERALIARLPLSTTLWRLDSPRKWLERSPFQRCEGIEAYRRFEISSLPVAGVGVGISVDVSTAFLGNRTLDYYFSSRVPSAESELRLEEFVRLTKRQTGQKGTLVYQVGTTTSVCYFEKGNLGQTCGRTPELKVNGKVYRSLYDYYSQRHPKAHVGESEPAVLVSFRGIEQPVWVAARLLRPRVMNDSLPDSLAPVDKIDPSQRVAMIEQFWAAIEEAPFAKVSIRMSSGFWQPPSGHIIQIPLPELEFADGRVLAPPSRAEASEYKKHYRQRTEMLESAGAYHIPPATDRTIHCAYPAAVPAEAARQLAGDVARAISKWARVPFGTNPVRYSILTDATVRLRQTASAGTVLFVLSENPAAYYDSAFQMAGWRLKRVTQESLLKHYKYLKEGAWDKKKKCMDSRRGWHKWGQYIQMNALDLFVQMDGIPFRVPSAGEFEAQLAIDVGYDRRYVAVSLLVARGRAMNPSFKIVTEVQPKTDHRSETINPIILADMIVQLMGSVFRGRIDPLRSLLVIRDGGFRGQETSGVHQAVERLKQERFLAEDALISLADLHKTSNRNIRLWERISETTVLNPLECQAVTLSTTTAALVTTGEATLHQGTAEPMAVSCEASADRLVKVIQATAAAAQLNWGSPGVAQRLPIIFKRTDEELDIRYAQEIRRVA